MSGNKSFSYQIRSGLWRESRERIWGGKVQVREGDEEEVGRGNSNAVLCLKKP